MHKVILITGASSGFGKSTALLLAAQGHIVYGTSRKPCDLPSVQMLVMDVRQRDSIQSAVDQIILEQGHIDVLINNAGVGIGGSLELATPEEIDLQMDTNFGGCVRMCQTILPHMRKQRKGQIINFSSIGGIMGLPYQGYYSASKFAIEGFSEALSAEVKRFGISVSIIEPGDFCTAFTATRKNSQTTLLDPDYGPIFKNTLSLIEKEENGGLKPEILSQKIAKIINSKHPKLRYPIANLEQRSSILLKKIVSGNLFVNVLRDYYKS